MPMLRIYFRVIALLAPEKWLAVTLALANLALAGAYFLEPWLFGKVVDALVDASRIDIYGVGASGFVAGDLEMKLQRIARPAQAWPDPHMAISSASLRGPGDVAIGLSHTGTTVDTIDALAEARSHGATTVAITNFPWSPITEVADHVLLTAARETVFRSGAMTSRIAQLTVVDCLFVTLAQRDLPRTMDALERTFTAAQAKRVRRTRHPRQPG